MEDPDLLVDLLLLILIKLPVKSLLRFRCVSKSWNLLISTQDFAKMHVEQSRIHPKPLALIWVEEPISKTHIFAVDCSELENAADTIQPLHHPMNGPSWDWEESVLIGACNGLLCVFSRSINRSRNHFSFLVFNPLIRKGSIFYGKSFWSKRDWHFYGFGYDDVHDDYKVVTWGIYPNKLLAYTDCRKFHVYSVKEASWSTRISGLTCFYTYGVSCGVLVNRVLHWICQNTKGKCSIVAFDLRTEQHMLMEKPDNDLARPEKNCDRMVLGALNGCLCGIVFNYGIHNAVASKLHLWVMKEYGLKDSWIKMTIDIPLRLTYGVGVHINIGEVAPIVPIIHVENKKQMILYTYEKGFLLCDMVINRLSKVTKIPQFDLKRDDKRRKRRAFARKEFSFQGSLVNLPCFHRFDSL